MVLMEEETMLYISQLQLGMLDYSLQLKLSALKAAWSFQCLSLSSASLDLSKDFMSLCALCIRMNADLHQKDGLFFHIFIIKHPSFSNLLVFRTDF